jgi:hypothetical protein
MTFKDAVGKTAHLENAWKEGLQALRRQDKPHIEPQDTRRLRGSADVDSALQTIEPNANRWDFAIAYQHTNLTAEFIYWVELHTASTSEVEVVIKKANWLLGWLKTQDNPLRYFQKKIVWVSSGPTTFSLTAPQKKAMALAGLNQCGLKLRIHDPYPRQIQVGT